MSSGNIPAAFDSGALVKCHLGKITGIARSPNAEAYRNNQAWSLIESAPVMAAVWPETARPGFVFRRIIYLRLARTLRNFGSCGPRAQCGFGQLEAWLGRARIRRSLPTGGHIEASPALSLRSITGRGETPAWRSPRPPPPSLPPSVKPSSGSRAGSCRSTGGRRWQNAGSTKTRSRRRCR